MNFADAVTSGFRRYFDFQGIAVRSEFWWFVLFLLLASIATGILDAGLGYGEAMTGPANGLFSLATLIPSLSLGARRLHDIGWSGWWQLIVSTGIGIFLLIYWWCQPSVTTFSQDGQRT